MLKSPNGNCERSQIMTLPDGILVLIFQHLDTIAMVQCSKVCRRWYLISQDKILTKSFDLRGCPMLLPELWKVSRRKLQQSTSSVHIKGKLDRSKNMEKLSVSYLDDLFTRCQHITNLSMESFDLRDVPLKLFCGLPSLESLSLKESMLSMGWFDLLKEHKALLPRLKVLNLNSCTKISNNDLLAISYLKNLQTLNFCQCYRISARGIPTIVANLKSLKHLDFSSCPAINNVVLYHLSTLHLTHLSLRFCHLITDAGVVELLKESGRARRTLKYLDLFSCHEITDKSLEVISLNAVALRSLDVGACKKVSQKKLEGLRADLPDCTVKCQVVDNEQLTDIHHTQSNVI